MKMIIANFEKYKTEIDVYGLDQYDYGQKLELHGLSLPEAVEVHFAVDKSTTEAERRVGITKDGVTTVAIPDKMLEQSRPIIAYVYVSNSVSGKTVRKVTMPINPRQKPQDFVSPDDPLKEDPFRDAVAAVNDAAERVETSEKSAEAWTHGSTDYPERDTDNARYYSELSKDYASHSESYMNSAKAIADEVKNNVDVVEKNTIITESCAAQAQQALSDVIYSEKNAKASENAAQEAQEAAEAAESSASVLARQMAADRESIIETMNDVESKAGQVEKNVETSKGIVDGFEMLHHQAVENINYQKQQAIQSVKSEGDAQVSNVQAVADGISQEKTAQKILNNSDTALLFLEEIAKNSGKAGSLNGFGLEKGSGDSVVITYTDQETNEFIDAVVLPRDSTFIKIDQALESMNESLKIIALQKGADA